MGIEHPKVIAAVFAAAREKIEWVEYIGTRGDGVYLALDARRVILGQITRNDDGQLEVEVFKIPAELLPN